VRYSSEHKTETRAKVLREAAREIRAKGPENFAITGVMKRAGLTHGGFYAHFPSKDALVAEAVGAMFDDARAHARTIAATDDPRAALLGYVDFYLSKAHRDARERGCPLPALSGDLARSNPAARGRFAEGVAHLTDRLATALGALGVPNAKAEASAMLSQLVGAVVLARAVEGAASDAVLADTRASLVARFALEPRA
jgi:TetR/AcrR family transcriptional repressor of nem operon